MDPSADVQFLSQVFTEYMNSQGSRDRVSLLSDTHTKQHRLKLQCAIARMWVGCGRKQLKPDSL
eukprot:11993743-Alexandrium_andersonii.AAC.1